MSAVFEVDISLLSSVAQAEVQASWVFPPAVVSLNLVFDPTLIECSCCALQIAVFSTEFKGFIAACLCRNIRDENSLS